MGASSLPPSPGSPSSLSLPPLHSPLDDWFNPSRSDHFSAEALPLHDSLSSAGGSSSSSSSSSDRPQCRSFLRSNDPDGPFRIQAHRALSQIGSPVLSCTPASREKPASSLHTSGGYAMATCAVPKCDATELSQAFHGESSHFANPNWNPLEENTFSCISSILTSAAASASASPVVLSSPASTGAKVTKVSKRRARVNKKAPIAVLSADMSNFREMVQQLTGIPPTHTVPHMWGSSGRPLVRPQPTRFAYNGDLPTLDTSVPFLGSRQMLPLLHRGQQPMTNGLFSSGDSANAAERSRGNMVKYDTSALTSTLGLGNVQNSGAPGFHQMKEMSAEKLVRECEHSFPRQSSSLLESLLMSDEDMVAKLPLSAVDSWLAGDGGALLNV